MRLPAFKTNPEASFPRGPLTRFLRHPHPYHLTRFLILRLLGLVYFVAFFTAVLQLIPLIGETGLTPVQLHLDQLVAHYGGTWNAFMEVPTLFLFGHSDAALILWSWFGVVGSLVVCIGYANGLLLLCLWFVYMSIINVGQVWYGFGWEIQLLETGFLAIFLCPFWDPKPFPKKPPPILVIWLYRWLIFRIMLGAGLIKIRGDACWRDFSCLAVHYETQPIPNPISWVLHQAPMWFHQAGVLFNHFVELIVPFFMLGPRRFRYLAGFLMLFFQVTLIVSGNLSFLNWLTIIPILACFDDQLLARALPSPLKNRLEQLNAEPPIGTSQVIIPICLTVLVSLLSIGPIQNLISSSQAMNTSFDRLHLVNTYGAFGSINQERYELVFSGTTDANHHADTKWQEFGFKCKPDFIHERPCVITPYHLRLDWLLWFAAMSTPQQHPWTIHLVYQLLHGDPEIHELLDQPPLGESNPQWVKVDLYRYTFTKAGEAHWWSRQFVGAYIPPLRGDDPNLRAFIQANKWHVYEPSAN